MGAIIVVRDGTVWPHIQLAQSTARMDWSKLELVVFAKEASAVKGLVCLPADHQLRTVSVVRAGDGFKLASDPFDGRVAWAIRDGLQP